MHKRADRKPEAVGQGELVDRPQQRNVVAVRIQRAHVTTLITLGPPPSGAKFQGQLHKLYPICVASPIVNNAGPRIVNIPRIFRNLNIFDSLIAASIYF